MVGQDFLCGRDIDGHFTGIRTGHFFNLANLSKN